jgi:hypothetical protein
MVSVEPIVDRELFERVSTQVGGNVNTLSGRASHRYTLKGLVWGGECGHRFCGAHDKRTRTTPYGCAYRDRTTGELLCSARSVRADKIEPAVWGEVRETFFRRDLQRRERLQELFT